MTESRLHHRLLAIIAADAVGYSRLMGSDSHATLLELDSSRDLFRQQAVIHGGRIVDTAGDSVLAAFDTGSGAVTAALSIQEKLNLAACRLPEDRRMPFRIGVHLGDVIEKPDGTIYGDGVNIAARLQALAEPGGVTVSEAIRSLVYGKVEASFEDLGEQRIKNIAEPVRAHRVSARQRTGDAIADSVRSTLVATIDLSLPDKPSIAVLAFTNMSGDSTQDSFTDGISEDIITELSRFHELFVIARNSSFTYKGRAVDIRVIAKELGVRYVVEGSIRRAGERVRVTAQLIDASTGSHVWAERYDRALTDIFEVQDEVTHSIVRAIGPKIIDFESERVIRRRPESLRGYEIAVRARAHIWQSYVKGDPASTELGIAAARSALAIDPRSALALFCLSLGQWQRTYMGTAADPRGAWKEGFEAADKLIEIDNSASHGYICKGVLQVNSIDGVQDSPHDLINEALSNLRRGYELNPYSNINVEALMYGENMAGNSALTFKYAAETMRISPRDPLQFNTYHQLSIAAFDMNRYEDGVSYALLGLAEAPGNAHLHSDLAKSYVGLGDLVNARSAFENAKRLWPQWVARATRGIFAQRNPSYREKSTAYLRAAGGMNELDGGNSYRA
jgi:adenylate cyclase